MSNNIKGQDITVLVDLDLRDIIHGKTVSIKYDCEIKWHNCKGTKAAELEHYIQCSNCKGAGYTYTNTPDDSRICDRWHGTGGFSRSKCGSWDAQGYITQQVTKEVYIAPGTINYYKAPGLGHWSKVVQGDSGDLFIKIKIKEIPNFKIKKNDIITTKTLRVTDAILGGTIKISTLHGDRTINLTKGTQHGDILSIPKLGIPNATEIGNLIIEFKVKIPKDLSETQLSLIKKLHDLEPREDLSNSHTVDTVDTDPQKKVSRKSMCTIF